MKKYQVTWGWEPPQYEARNNGNVRVFFASEKKTETREHVDPETGETTSEEVAFWLCDVAEYEKGVEEDMKLIALVKDAPGSDECRRALLRARIKAYDKSAHVEDFSIGGIHLWLAKDTRTGLLLRFQAEKAAGKTETALWHEGMKFPMEIDTGIQMLYALEVYASETYDHTAMHDAAAMAMTEGFEEYDYTAGYPDKLAF